MNSTKFMRSFVGGRGAGKTKVGALDLIQRSLVQGKRDRTYMVCSPDYTMLEDGPIKDFTATLDERNIPHKLKKSPRPQTSLPNGNTVLFRSMDDPEKRRGPNLSGVWLDEASLMKHEAFLLAIASLRQAGERGWITATFTPKGKLHWTYKVFGKVTEDNDLFHCATKDNPFLPDNFESILRGQYEAAFAAQELGGEFIDVEGTVFHPATWPRYKDFGDAFKLGRQLLYASDLPIYITVDPAASAKNRSDHTAFVVAALTPSGELLILEVVNKHWALKEIMPNLAALCKRWKPIGVGIEAVAFQAYLVDDAGKYPEIPEVLPLSPKGKNKRQRATPAILKGENGHIWLPPEAPWLDDFQLQLASFTGLDDREQDDMVDALAYMADNMLRLWGGGVEDEPMGVLVGGRSRI